jgi:hypothetical protein
MRLNGSLLTTIEYMLLSWRWLSGTGGPLALLGIALLLLQPTAGGVGVFSIGISFLFAGLVRFVSSW